MEIPKVRDEKSCITGTILDRLQWIHDKLGQNIDPSREEVLFMFRAAMGAIAENDDLRRRMDLLVDEYVKLMFPKASLAGRVLPTYNQPFI